MGGGCRRVAAGGCDGVPKKLHHLVVPSRMQHSPEV